MAPLGLNLLTEVLPALVIVFGSPIAIWWYLRRSRKGSVGRLHISDRAALGKNVWMAVVEVDDKRFLVGAGESGVGLISELDALPEIAQEPADEPVDEPVNSTNGITEQPRIGLVRRLQLMTVRGPAESPWRSFGGSRK
jgi:flagellar biogenesis protein FliO